MGREGRRQCGVRISYALMGGSNEVFYCGEWAGRSCCYCCCCLLLCYCHHSFLACCHTTLAAAILSSNQKKATAPSSPTYEDAMRDGIVVVVCVEMREKERKGKIYTFTQGCGWKTQIGHVRASPPHNEAQWSRSPILTLLLFYRPPVNLLPSAFLLSPLILCFISGYLLWRMDVQFSSHLAHPNVLYSMYGAGR